MKRIIIEIEPKEGTDDNLIKASLKGLLKKVEGWANETFQNTKVFLEEIKEEKQDENRS